MARWSGSGGLVFKAHRFLYHSTLGLATLQREARVSLWNVVIGVSYERSITPLGPYSRTMPRALWWP